MTITTCIFDAYGTLFDVSSAARALASRPDRVDFAEHWAKVATDWRHKQLQYTWLRAITDAHTDFWSVTQDGLDFALEASGLSDDRRLREELLELYWHLAAYAEVPRVLSELKEAGLSVAILSNGSPDMLTAAVRSAGIADLLDDILSVEAVGVFKPHKSVYDLVGQRFGNSPNTVLFVSSNGWDAAGAAGYGFQTAWINRTNEPMDRLPWTPQSTLKDLLPIPELVTSL
jgi:2-haloacid dehalogenase